MTERRSDASLLSRHRAFIAPLLLATCWPVFVTRYSVHTGVIGIRLTVFAGIIWCAVAGEGSAFLANLRNSLCAGTPQQEFSAPEVQAASA